jgi:hypothetical protein
MWVSIGENYLINLNTTVLAIEKGPGCKVVVYWEDKKHQLLFENDTLTKQAFVYLQDALLLRNQAESQNE